MDEKPIPHPKEWKPLKTCIAITDPGTVPDIYHDILKPEDMQAIMPVEEILEWAPLISMEEVAKPLAPGVHVVYVDPKATEEETIFTMEIIARANQYFDKKYRERNKHG